jgi:hypothetical protein
MLLLPSVCAPHPVASIVPAPSPRPPVASLMVRPKLRRTLVGVHLDGWGNEICVFEWLPAEETCRSCVAVRCQKEMKWRRWVLYCNRPGKNTVGETIKLR